MNQCKLNCEILKYTIIMNSRLISQLNSVAAEYWKVPDSLGVENTGAVDDLKL